ncbi:M16 family metallopeptidase [Methylovirgula sp. 4M-Z18]|uniref:M16 family metallopeptidase n=1 Tax=Methylovirgula sp. 4M-Z18 TaxID=2293567 RepID=UPI0018F2E7B1|nr:pitrilysin family protein [Methylovirgula sp. 4M-Z18]
MTSSASSAPPRSQSPHDQAGKGAPAISSFFLANGMQVVVIPDHRAPVATHMVWYRNGSADDPAGKSGIAHFLEHLMFKGTAKHPMGEFSNVVAELGGQENAFTSNDYTAYFQRLPREHLKTAMEFEADRMTGLVLTDEVVNPERDVVLEERRMRTDSDPGAQLSEAVQAALFVHHPYGKPIIGWNHEIEGLSREDALAYYRRFYTPENAILVIAGDVGEAEVRELAEDTYGRIAARGDAPKRARPQEPEPRAHRLVTLNDEKVEQPNQQRIYLTPSYATAASGEAEALEVLAHLLGGGQTSRLYKALVLDQKVAVGAGAYYMGTALDATRFYLYATPAPGVSLATLDKAMDDALAEAAETGFDPADITRAKTRLVADAIYARDNQVSLAQWYGASLTTGLTIDDVRQWTDRIDAVTPEAVQTALQKWLVKNRAVTGHLLPKAA